jgi:hypothetical protein
MALVFGALGQAKSYREREPYDPKKGSSYFMLKQDIDGTREESQTSYQA